ELGHFFGLLHTFQDSNNPDVSKRELVSRDIGSGGNCDKTGDYLCDTPSDPFERLVSISSYSCNDKLPDDLVDAFGTTFSPPVDNIMSYHVRCGNVFTSGQYQRMLQSFSIRFSPSAAYNLLGNQANYLIVNSLNK
ncbi:MAG: M43 family zinc metalloprotease, partial [Spirosomaceae bacterium]|nr:M43 family zinc metalloprotease [Spirosomataceae bacterium]